MERHERPETRRDAELVEATRAGHGDAFARLVEAWFDRCWEVSWRILRDRDRAADVTQDIFLTAWQKLDTLADPGAFGGWVLRMSRNRSLDRLSHERRVQPTDEEWMLEPRDPTVTALADPEREAVRTEVHDLVWDAAAALGERDASILDLHLRHGLEPRELAGELGIDPNAANQALHRMRGRLGAAIRARVLWRKGNPDCAALAADLHRAPSTGFDTHLVRVIDRHVKNCAECTDRQRRAAVTLAAFAAVPFVAASPALRATSAQALAANGVPVPAEWTAASAPGDGDGEGAAEASAGVDTPHGVRGEAGEGIASPKAGFARADRARAQRIGMMVLAATGVLLLAAGVGVVAGVLGTPAPVGTSTPSPAPSIPASASPTPVASTTTPVTPAPSSPVPTPTVPPPAPSEPAPETTQPASPAPTVRVSAVWVGVDGCPNETPFLYRITWSASDADTAHLGGSWGDDEVALTGVAEHCGPQSARFTLTAIGPGGEAVETVEAQATPAG
ncbi:sigma-70 family RNA polymerase sigma factor [Microbacterium aquimaris]|uniref:RNA polymerase sigma factor n=1 Tax=Microbacterium aquimaris TaxID=459816 RepID=UPI002AD415DA|nr:sigma-70 family RNA polymerase sigma factor [Microbacterium aquimaris]MDZ8275364.1 sigma-70 family RNA polymerase sigma factor [Microbacterium aquimaris]